MSSGGMFTQPPVDPDAPGISKTTLTATWVFTCLAVVAVSMRFWLRKKFFNCHSDDWVMLSALLIQIVYQACITLACNWGMGKAFENMTLEMFIQSQKWSFSSITASQTASVVARVSIVILLCRIFGVTKPAFRWFLIIFTTFMAIVAALGLVFLWAEKTPVESHWDPMVPATWHLDKRVSQYTSLGLQFLYAISDLTYVVFPIAFIYKVQMPRARKIGLIILLGLSILTAGACIAKISIMILGLTNQLPMSFSPDFGGVVFLTSSIEQCLVIIMGCIPTLGPLAKFQYAAFFSAIGDSFITLLGSRGSQRGSSRDRRSVYRDREGDIELGRGQRSTSKIRASDEASGASDRSDSVKKGGRSAVVMIGNEHHKVEPYSVTASADGSQPGVPSPRDKNRGGIIRRDDTYGVSYDRTETSTTY
ncbi:hypothetical protein V8F20_005166 [Naviculisporaceae sp. PSN 640]